MPRKLWPQQNINKSYVRQRSLQFSSYIQVNGVFFGSPIIDYFQYIDYYHRFVYWFLRCWCHHYELVVDIIGFERFMTNLQAFDDYVPCMRILGRVYDITLRNVIQRKEGMYKSWSSKVAIAKEWSQMKFVTTKLMSCLFLQYTSIGQFYSPIMSTLGSLSKNHVWHHHHQVWEVAYDKYDCGVT